MKTMMPKPVAWRFERPGISKLDSWPHGGDWERLYTEAQLKAAMVAAWNDAIDESVTAMWHSYTEGPEAIEVLMDKLKEQTP